MIRETFTIKRPESASTDACFNVLLKEGDGRNLKLVQNSNGFNGVLSTSDFCVASLQDAGALIGKTWPDFAEIEFSFCTQVVEKTELESVIQWLSFGLLLSLYQYQHAPTPELKYQLPELQVDAAHEDALLKAKVLAQSVAVSRELMNKPANIITPFGFIEAVEFLSLENIEYSYLDRLQMTEMGFGGLLGVGQGSSNPPALLKMEYRHENARKTLALVGKGITFDSGGISLKGAKQMSTMKFDMGGAAAVVGAMYAVSQLNPDMNVVAYCALAENMPSATAQRPGDVVTMLSGKTVEIISTDAEGRMILADALWFAQQDCKPDYLVDIATLTGGVGVALGKAFAGVLGTEESLIDAASKGGELCAEPVWQLPLDNWFEQQLESPFADLRHGSEDPHGSPCVAATFLKQFIQPETPWIHIDTAAMSCEMKHRHLYDKGATGYGVLLLHSLCENLGKRVSQNLSGAGQ